MTATPQEILKARLTLARGILSLSPTDPERIADATKLFPELVTAAEEMASFHEGFAKEHHALLRSVFELLGTITVFSQGRFHWSSEVPSGTAGPFKRAANALITFINERLNT